MALDYSILGTVLNDITIFGVHWVIILILTFLATVFVTRTTEDWPAIIFPMYVGMWVIGLNANIVAGIILLILFVLTSLGEKGFAKEVDLKKNPLKIPNPFHPYKTLHVQNAKKAKPYWNPLALTPFMATKGDKQNKLK